MLRSSIVVRRAGRAVGVNRNRLLFGLCGSKIVAVAADFLDFVGY